MERRLAKNGLESNKTDEALITETPELSVDEALQLSGPFGKYEIICMVFFFLLNFQSSIEMMLPYFTTETPDWECMAGHDDCNMTGVFGADDVSRCAISREAWKYNNIKEYSLVTTFELDCDRKWLSVMPYVCFFVGNVAVPVVGWFSDKYGRRRAALISYSMNIAAGLGSALAPNIWIHLLFRFIIGACWVAPIIDTIASEYTTPAYKAIMLQSTFIAYGVGLSFFCLKAYFIRNWKLLTIVSTTPYIILVLFLFWIHEPVHWLYVHGQTDLAISKIRRIATFNRKKLPDLLRLKPHVIVTNIATLLDLLRDRTARKNLLIQSMAYFVMRNVWVSLSLVSNDYVGSIYLNLFATSVVEIPAIFVSIFLSNKLGRKPSTIGGGLITGVTCLVIGCLPKAHARVRLALGVFAKLVHTIGICAMVSWSNELFPTTHRSLAASTVVSVGCVGAILAPYLVKFMKPLGIGVPFIAMSIMSFFAGLIQFTIAETNGRETLQTLSQEVSYGTLTRRKTNDENKIPRV